MVKRYFLLYLIVLTIPLFLGLVVWQSNRYQNLENELARLEQTQMEWVESNKRLISGIAEYSSAQKIEQAAVFQLELKKIRPENLLQVYVTGGKGNGL